MLEPISPESPAAPPPHLNGVPAPAPAPRGGRLAVLQQAVRSAESAAVLVTPGVLNRVVRQACGQPGWPWHALRRTAFVVDRHVLFRHVEQDELDLGSDQLLPPTVILLARPSPEELDGLSPEALLLTYWRRLFHAEILLQLNRPGTAPLSDAEVRQRVEQIGPAEFAEVRQVLTQDGYLPAAAADREVYAEFAALYLQLRYFAPELLPGHFAGLGDLDRIDRLLARDVDAEGLFKRTRLAGAPEPCAPSGAPVAEWNEEYVRLVRAAEAAARAGNGVKAAILRTRAARVAPAALAPAARAEAAADLRRLTDRLCRALRLSPAEGEEWLRDLPALLEHADQGRRPVEAALLYDLQNVCLDNERDLYALGLVEAVLSGGRRPVKRLLPCQRPVRTVRHLRAAAGRLPRTRLSDADRAHLGGLLTAALRGAEERLHERFGPLLRDAFQDVGLAPANPPERVAFDKLLDELLERISRYGFLTFADLRDAVSRNQLKLPDLASPGQLIRGDELRRLDRRLTVLLDGVYRPGEFYVRWLEGFASLNFGTEAGRAVTTYVTLPFGGAFVAVEAVTLALGHLAEVHLSTATQLVSFVFLALFLFGLLHVPAVRRACVRLGRGALRLGRLLFVELPARAWRVPFVRQVLASWPVQLGYWYVLKPLAICAVLMWLLPEVFATWVGGISTFLAVNFLLNSRLGAAAGEALTRAGLGLLELLRAGLIPGLYRFVVRLYKRILDTGEYLLFCVDEWLRWRSGDSGVSLVTRTVLGVLWFPVSYVARLYMVVLIEPALNPLKFPVCSVAAKFISLSYPAVIGYLGAQLAPLVGPVPSYFLAVLLTAVTVGLTPNAFGFLFWEMKENWRLYRANRRPTLAPVAVGGHGETVVQLLRPGFHSGTVPRQYVRLRRAERRAHVSGNWQPAEAVGHRLEEVGAEVRHFVDREMLALLRQARAWQGTAPGVGQVRLSPNRIGVELVRADAAGRPMWLEWEERAGWLVAGVRVPGWLDDLAPVQREGFAAALAGLYKRAGVQLVREQLRATLPAGVAGYDVVSEGLVVWPEGRGGRALTYDLREGVRRLEPRGPDGLRVPDGPVLDADRLVFARVPLRWLDWVETWEQEQEGKSASPWGTGNLEPPVLPAAPGSHCQAKAALAQ